MIALRTAACAGGALFLSLVALAACGDGGSGSGGAGGTTATGGAGGAPAEPYKPAGCAFEVGSRPEYTEWAIGKTDTAADPEIVRVRLGLGGNVTAGEPGYADPSTSIGVAWESELGTLASEIQ